MRSDKELRQRWEQIVEAEDFVDRTLWLTWYDSDSQMLPVVMPIDALPRHPHRQALDGLAHVATSVLEDQACAGSVAMLLSRPGPPAIDDCDRAWARALASLADTGLTMRPLHLATSDSVRVLAADVPG